MGIVAKQTISNTFIIFCGAFLGAVNILLLYPIVLADEQIGLTRLLLTFTVIISQIATIGGPMILVKYIPKYIKGKGDYQGLASFVFYIGLVGFAFALFFLIFGKSIFEYFYSENSKLFISYFYYLIPLIFFQITINIFGGFLQALFKSVFPLFINELVLRLLQTAILILYFLKAIDFSVFMILFVGIFGITSFVQLVYLVYHKNISVPKSNNIKIKDRIEMIKYGLANILTGLASNLTNRIDLMMIGAMAGGAAIVSQNYDFDLGLKYITIYTISLYMSTLIEMPARALGNIAITFIGKAFNDKDLPTVEMIYKKSAINQLLIGVLIFITIWASIDNLLLISGKDYSSGKWVFLLLGLAKLFHVASGMNGKIIVLSKYYIVGIYLTIGLAFLTFITNLILIPVFNDLPGRSGIEGAALATSISILIFNITAVIFLWNKYKFQPYNVKSILTVIAGILLLVISSCIPENDNLYLDIIIRSFVVVTIFTLLVYSLRISEDFNRIIKKTYNLFLIKTTKNN